MAIIIGILLINHVSAINIYAGESYTFDLREKYSYYKITENSTEVNLDIQQNGTNVTIRFSKYMKNDTFSITFYNKKDEPIEVVGGGSSGGGDICYRGWKTTEWSECIDGIQTREVIRDLKTCYQTKQEKPIDSRPCEIPKEDDRTDIKTVPPNKEDKKPIWLILIVSFIIIAGIFIILKKNWRFKKDKKKVKKEEEK